MEYVKAFQATNESRFANMSLLKDIHTSAMQGTGFHSVFRKGDMVIVNSPHRPPPACMVVELVKQCCQTTNSLLATAVNPYVVGAYCLWWVNYIHPFEEG